MHSKALMLLAVCVLASSASASWNRIRQKWNRAKMDASSWNKALEIVGRSADVVTPGDLDQYIQRRRNELAGQYGSSLLLWKGIKGELLENSSSKAHLFAYSSSAIGMCANMYDLKRGVLKVFIADELHSDERSGLTPSITWKFVEFYPRCCTRTVTSHAQFYYFRECTPEEQTVLIEDTLRRQNQSYHGALMDLHQRFGRPTSPSKQKVIGPVSAYASKRKLKPIQQTKSRSIIL